MATVTDRRKQAVWVVDRLEDLYPDAECELDYADPWQLLVATLLSAQTTDKRVNLVTPELFRRFPGPLELSAAGAGEVEQLIRSIGLFRNKARSLRAAAAIVVEQHGCSVPADLKALVALPGVGPKTAKVVLGEAFSLAVGVVVDTHVARLSRRLSLASSTDAEVVAGELETVVDKESWIEFSRRLIHHGRRICTARSPQCDACGFAQHCPRIGVPEQPES